MANDSELEAGIRVPEGIISSGKTFRPSKAFRNKLWFEGIFLVLFFYAVSILGWLGISYLIFLDDGNIAYYWTYVNQWWLTVNFWYWLATLIWFMPFLILVPVYIGRIRYSITSEAGESMPEVFVRKGLINITEKSVPYRAVTNISSRAGIFDRMFRIGNVEVQTAGYAGARQMGPEIKLEGLRFHKALRDYILGELRKFREPYATTTEAVVSHEEPIPKFDELLLTVREIKEILRTKL